MQTLKQKLLPIKTEINVRLKAIQSDVENLSLRKDSLEAEANTLKNEMSLLSKLLDELSDGDSVKASDLDFLFKKGNRPKKANPKTEPADEATRELATDIYEYFDGLGSKSKGMAFPVNCKRIRERLSKAGDKRCSDQEISICIDILRDEGWIKVQHDQGDEHSFIIQMLDPTNVKI